MHKGIHIPTNKEWSKESAGRHMTKKVPVVHGTDMLVEVQNLITGRIAEFDTVNYVYIVDANHVLQGVLSIKEIFQSDHDKKISTLLQKGQKLVSVRPYADRESAVYKALKHNIKAVPITDTKGVFLGVLPSDALLSIMYKESREDFLHIAGIRKTQGGGVQVDNVLEIPIIVSLKHRLPWLLIGLCIGLIGAFVIRLFQGVLSEYIFLALFTPLMTYVSGAVSMQMMVFAVRDFVVMPTIDTSKYLAKQSGIVVVIAVILGSILGVFGGLLYQDPRIGFVLGVSLMVAIVSSIFTGLLVPFFFSRLKIDPANVSGPLGTAFSDLLTIVVYFSTAALFL